MARLIRSVRNNFPGISVFKYADMMIVFAMDLTLPDEQMQPFVEFLEYGQAGVRDPLQPALISLRPGLTLRAL